MGFFFTRNFFGWEIFSDLHCQKIRSSCFDISLKMWRQTRLVIIAVILVGFFFNLWDLWQIHSNQETRHLFGVKTKMSRFVIDFVVLAYTDKMNAINRFQCSSWASPILAMAIFFKNWRDDIQMWRKLNFWWPLKRKFFSRYCVSSSHPFVYSVTLCSFNHHVQPEILRRFSAHDANILRSVPVYLWLQTINS